MAIPTSSPWLFFGVTFAFTWTFWLAALALGYSMDSAGGLLLLLAGLAGPGVAGVGFTYLVYGERGRRDYWRRLVDVGRIGLRWGVVIVLLAPAVNVLAALLDVLAGGTGARWSAGVAGFAADPLALLPAVFFATLPPFVEELGWRGYVLDRLQLRHSALTASVLLGVVWSVWHLPLFFVAGSYQHGLGVGTLEFWLFLVGVVPLSVALSWLYNNTARSTLAVVLLHGMVNFTGELVHVTPRADAIAVLVWALLAVAIAVRWGPASLAGSAAPPRPPESTPD